MNETTTQPAVNRPRLAPCADSSFTGRVAAHSLALPPELSERAVTRLGWTALLYGFVFVLMYWAHESAVTPELKQFRPFFRNLALAASAMGFSMWAIARYSRLPARRILDLALLFEVAGALAIGLSDARIPSRGDGVPVANSSIALWLVYFTLVVPSSLPRALAATLLAAFMGPLGAMLCIVIYGNPSPPASHWVIQHMSGFVMGIAAVAMTRYVYDIGAQLSREREMGSYVLMDRIGQGGMGEVWRARHRMLARDAAVKLIRPEVYAKLEQGGADVARKRFELEAKATAALRSPHTVTVHDYGVSSDGVFYYVMELLQGMDLDDFIRRHGPMPPDRAIYVLRQICDSLEEAHTSGLVHRDIKPRNVFLCRLGVNADFVKVLDFGLVKRFDGGGDATVAQLTQEGSTAGTPAFLSPEAALGSTVDHRADIYATGCVAYWLLTGQLVFPNPSPLAMVVDHAKTKPAVPSERSRFDLPPGLDELILECLEKDPTRRPQSTAEIRRRLDALPVEWNAERARQWWDAEWDMAMTAS